MTTITATEQMQLDADRSDLVLNLKAAITDTETTGTELTAGEQEALRAGIAKVQELTNTINTATVEVRPQTAATDPTKLVAGDFIDTATGRRASLRKGESLQAAFRGYRDEAENRTEGQYGSLGNLMAALTTSGSSAVVPTTWSQQILGLVVANSAIGQAGSTTIPMLAKTVEIGRITGDPTAAFRSEGSSITASDPAFDNVTLTAHTMNALIVASIEWLQDAENASDLLQQTIVQGLGVQLDKIALYGGVNHAGLDLSAAVNPVGIYKNLSTNLSANILGAATNGTVQTSTSFWGEVLDTVYTVRDANFEPNALVWGTKLDRVYAKATDSTGRYLARPEGIPSIFTSNSVASGYTQGTLTSAADLFTGDFSQLLVGVRSGLTLQTLTERYADSGQVGFLATWRGDIQLAHPGAFAVYSALKGA